MLKTESFMSIHPLGGDKLKKHHEPGLTNSCLAASMSTLNLQMDSPQVYKIKTKLFSHVHVESDLKSRLGEQSLLWLNRIGSTNEPTKIYPEELEKYAEEVEDGEDLLLIKLQLYDELQKLPECYKSVTIEIEDQVLESCKISKRSGFARECFLFRLPRSTFKLKMKITTESKSLTSTKFSNALSRAKNVFDAFRFGKRKISNGPNTTSLHEREPIPSSSLLSSSYKTASLVYHHHQEDQIEEFILEGSKSLNIKKMAYSTEEFVLYNTTSGKSDSMMQVMVGCAAFISKNSPVKDSHFSHYQNDYLTILTHNNAPKIPTWKRYYASIQDGRLVLYDFNYKNKKEALMFVDLKTIVKVKDGDPERLIQDHGFHIVSDSGVRYFLYADSETAMKKWMDCLNAVISKYTSYSRSCDTN